MMKVKCFLILIHTFMFSLLNINSQNNLQLVDKIPIIGWYGVPQFESTVKRFVEQRESGITYNFSFYSNPDQLKKALDSAEVAGVKIIITCPELYKTPALIVKRFMNHPALAGYYLQDEPDRSKFEELGKLVNLIDSIDNKHFCYLNLLPNYVSPRVLGTKTYRDYIHQFIEKVPTGLISFDNYPIIVDSLNRRTIRPGWYENLEIVSDEARKVNKPFWAFALTTAHREYPVPSLAEIRLQVFTNLAYGAQGIQYFTYWTPEGAIHKKLNFRNGPIDNLTKKKTVVYDYMENVNNDILNLSNIFYNSKLISVTHTGKTIPKGTTRLTKLPNEIKSLRTKGLGATISILEKENNLFMVIVNRDFNNIMEVQITGRSPIWRILKDGASSLLTRGKNTFIVDPGDVLIYTWKNK